MERAVQRMRRAGSPRAQTLLRPSGAGAHLLVYTPECLLKSRSKYLSCFTLVLTLTVQNEYHNAHWTEEPIACQFVTSLRTKIIYSYLYAYLYIPCALGPGTKDTPNKCLLNE